MSMIFIAGPKNYNNYPFIHQRLEYCLDKRCAVTVLNINSPFHDIILNYCYNNNIECYLFESDIKMLGLTYLRNAIVFDYNTESSNPHLKYLRKVLKCKILPSKVNEEDILTFHYGHVNDDQYGTRFFERLKNNQEFLKQAKDGQLTFTDTESDAAVVYSWIKNKHPEYFDYCETKKQNKKEKRTFEKTNTSWSENGDPDHDITTADNLIIAHGYTGVVQDKFGNQWVECSDDQVNKKNLHRTKEELEDDELHASTIVYHTNDHLGLIVFYQNKDFNGDTEFKANHWYLKPDYLR